MPERSRISTLLSRDEGLRSLNDDTKEVVDVGTGDSFSLTTGFPFISGEGFSGALGAFSALVAADLLATIAGMMLRMLISPGGET